MKKVVTIVLMIVISLTGCSSINVEDFEQIEIKYNMLKSEIDLQLSNTESVEEFIASIQGDDMAEKLSYMKDLLSEMSVSIQQINRNDERYINYSNMHKNAEDFYNMLTWQRTVSPENSYHQDYSKALSNYYLQLREGQIPQEKTEEIKILLDTVYNEMESINNMILTLGYDEVIEFLLGSDIQQGLNNVQAMLSQIYDLQEFPKYVMNKEELHRYSNLSNAYIRLQSLFSKCGDNETDKNLLKKEIDEYRLQLQKATQNTK